MINFLHRLLVRHVIKANRRALKGRECPHAHVTYSRECGKWSHPKPHPHPMFADKLKVRTRETVERVTCDVCAARLSEKTVVDFMDASGNA